MYFCCVGENRKNIVTMNNDRKCLSKRLDILKMRKQRRDDSTFNVNMTLYVTYVYPRLSQHLFYGYRKSK